VVSSKRQGAANKTNASLSTGPRTARGKQISKMNARVHGLSSPIRSQAGAEEAIEQLADSIVEAAARPDLRALAVRISEAEIDLRRIKRSRVVNDLAEIASDLGWPHTPDSVASLAGLPLKGRSSNALDRYERRALSRRKSAICDFDKARVRSDGAAS
jgi:hypothetical protein